MTSEGSTAAIGFRVLVVEDDFLVAQRLKRQLVSLGCEVIGPAGTVEIARNLIRETELDAAILDIAMTPGTSAPVARDLQYRDLPFVFVTGYGNLRMLPDDLRGHRVLMKPLDRETLHEAITTMVRNEERQQRE